MNGVTNYSITGDLSTNSDSGIVINKSYVLTGYTYILNALWKKYTPDNLFLNLNTNLSPLALTATTYKVSYSQNIPFSGDFYLYPSQNNNYAGNRYTVQQSGDNYTITITNVHNGLADGTFTGQLSAQGVIPATVTITSGEFKDVKIIN